MKDVKMFIKTIGYLALFVAAFALMCRGISGREWSAAVGWFVALVLLNVSLALDVRAEERETILNMYRREYEATREGFIDVLVTENPDRTYLEDFKSKFPDAEYGEDGMPHICPHHLYPAERGCSGDCTACWSRKMKKQEEEDD